MSGGRPGGTLDASNLLAAVFGVLLVALPGTARILQLRSARRHTSVDRSAVDR